MSTRYIAAEFDLRTLVVVISPAGVLHSSAVIIALGMAKEGFDWKFCEHALTVGYRGSLTEVIQIIGRCTRDSVGKKHAQFTNLIAKPDARDTDVAISVNNMLKAITCSLLMEQVLAPVIKFKPKQEGEDTPPGEIRVKGLKGATTERVKKIIEQDINDLKAAILSDDAVTKAVAGIVDPEVLNKVLIPKVIETKYPHLTKDEQEQVRQHVVADAVIRGGEIELVRAAWLRPSLLKKSIKLNSRQLPRRWPMLRASHRHEPAPRTTKR